MSWKPIVVGVDASPEATAAAAFASVTADRAGTSCQLVHATRDALALVHAPEIARYRHALVDQAHRQIEAALLGKVPPTVLARLIVRLGPTAAVLKHAVAELGAGLVVLGGKHRAALGRWFAGSASLNVARTTAVPVLVTAGAPAIRRVLAAVDVSGAARPTLKTAERYAALFGAELRVLNVQEPVPVIPDAPPVYDVREYYALTQQMLERDVWPLIRTPGVEKVTRHGMAVETILREVGEWNADLLIVGSHGKGWAERVLVGSVTERLLTYLPTSLVMVPVSAAEALAPTQAGPAVAAA